MTGSQRRQRLIERLQHGPVLVGDGAMGTQLYHRGAPLDSVFEYLNLIRPEMVGRVHSDYLAAGAGLIETNTFGANALRLDGFGLAGKVAAINLAGARLARAAAGDEGLVAGAVGPLPVRAGDPEPDAAQCRRVFAEQMQALADGGVDCLLLETFARVGQLELAVQTATATGLPVIAQLAFAEGGFTGDGLTVEAAAARLEGLPLLAIGANCGAGPRELLAVLRRLAAVSRLPLSAFANSGYPEYVDGRHIYLTTPDYFARLGREMVEAGASLIGGCCGTGPEQIVALATVLRDRRPGARHLAAPSAAPPTGNAPPPAVARRHFLDGWGERPVVTVELDLPRGLAVDKTLARARQLAAAGVDAINLAENPLAKIRIGNLALAGKIQEQTGIETIVHVTGRDRNLIGLHSELMGAHLLGIRSVLAVTGDPVVGPESGASNVFDLNSIGLLKLLTALNSGHNLFGAELGGRTDFLAGAAFNPNAADLSGQLHKLRKKIDAGARFIQTQPVFDPALPAKLVPALAPFNVPVLLGIMPLVSERNAEFLHNEVPGIQLPATVRVRMRGMTGAAGMAEGLAIAGEVIAAAQAAGITGYYLIPPFGRIELALQLLGRIREAA
ncbi:MAG: bifunctional homocysteine S-methyltransferase/methylenetetrahydrofolate reductase [Desulfuromonadales bacterium]|nr:bifunctional homocysteine S-methyltransferase/methylenetetrahydrofolate reductase [Desulfuromonadales bacterium]